ncbi:SMP-30/gluconolactonase/LRE family protein [Breoghania sp.]|uniref:SMP-30/gluconolactonase/LRE family protein n=1 Tax=Breoghania sp. TaxID=2065378 RepID=UPI002AA6457C|nr:SMP-30/gluconolactonase/LRE family protein [Breoghania sp.]
MTEVFDDRPCELGEGAFWHPERRQFFWFDILGRKLLSRTAEGPVSWDMSEHASAAGWIDRDGLIVASETGLYRFDIPTGERTRLAALEEDRPQNRSNDGRADPMGGFWIGTMGKEAEPEAGAIYRFHGGKVHRLFDGISIPNAICFTPDGRRAYYADTARRKIWTVALDAAGWPSGSPQIFVDLREEGLNPDGAVIDAQGALWNAQWGAGRVARYLPDGRLDRTIDIPARNASCPCFGGTAFNRLYVTSAREGLTDPKPDDGRTFILDPGVKGCAEPRVTL